MLLKNEVAEILKTGGSGSLLEEDNEDAEEQMQNIVDMAALSI
jgi:hypothetical protein